jgi:hypothetical protein
MIMCDVVWIESTPVHPWGRDKVSDTEVKSRGIYIHSFELEPGFG